MNLWEYRDALKAVQAARERLPVRHAGSPQPGG